jgi:hypothetical protein
MFSRRDFIKTSFSATAGLSVASAAVKKTKVKARSVIQIWMWGGPAHIDTFDPKPDAGYDYVGPLNKSIQTNVNGIEIGQSLPRLAKLADKYSIIRSMTHGINGHETASYMVQTGRKQGGRLVYPCVGAVVSKLRGYETGYKGLIPPYVVLTKPQGRFSEAGFLGSKYKPFATGGNPAAKRFEVEGIVAKGITRDRQIERKNLLQGLDTYGGVMPDYPLITELSKAQKEAYDLILGKASDIFNLETEGKEMRERYGTNPFGQSCLMARRLVEEGVPYITINYTGWDTHKQHFETMRNKLPQLDQGMAALLEDLQDRRLLDSTIVWWGGEFGRTPRIQWDPPWNGGRSHFGYAFSSLLAGGGFKGGQVIGATDAKGEEVKERPVYPWDMIGSIYSKLGIDPQGTIKHPHGFDVPLTPSRDDGVPVGGQLTEIM